MHKLGVNIRSKVHIFHFMKKISFVTLVYIASLGRANGNDTAWLSQNQLVYISLPSCGSYQKRSQRPIEIIF